MPQDAPGNPGARRSAPAGGGGGSGYGDAGQASPLGGGRSGPPVCDLFNFVNDPASLDVGSAGRGQPGPKTPGMDGNRPASSTASVSGCSWMIRAPLKSGTFRPLPVRQGMIPKKGGKLRKLGIPAVADRVVQAALKLVLEPIFEADFEPSPTGSARSGGRTTRSPRSTTSPLRGLRLGAGRRHQGRLRRNRACALMERLRKRIKDKRVLALVKAFLKAGVMTPTATGKRPTPAPRQAGSVPADGQHRAVRAG